MLSQSQALGVCRHHDVVERPEPGQTSSELGLAPFYEKSGPHLLSQLVQ